MSGPYPRVLLVTGEPISRRYAAGITMGNLFRGWPLDRIAQVYSDDSEPDESVCTQTWRLGVEDVQMPGWLRHQVAKQKAAHDARARSKAADETRPPQTRPMPQERIASAAKAAFLAYAKYAPSSIPTAVDRGVAAFGPEVIYSALESRRIMGVALDYAQRLTVPLVPHFMDDWMTAAASPRSGLLDAWARRDLERKALCVMHYAPVRLVIGEHMAVAYERRYGYQFLPFSNCIDLGGRPVAGPSRGTSETFRFGFAGGVHLGRADALTDVIDALEHLNAEGAKTEIVIYRRGMTEALPHTVLRAPLARLANAREESLLETAGCEVDALLLVDTFEETGRRYSQFSLSAKLPWYLAAGVPVFAYGAPELGTIRFCLERQCADVVVRRDAGLLRSRLGRFVNDRGLRETLGAKARLVAEECFDARVQRDAFRRVLSQACGEEPGVRIGPENAPGPAVDPSPH